MPDNLAEYNTLAGEHIQLKATSDAARIVDHAIQATLTGLPDDTLERFYGLLRDIKPQTKPDATTAQPKP